MPAPCAIRSVRRFSPGSPASNIDAKLRVNIESNIDGMPIPVVMRVASRVAGDHNSRSYWARALRNALSAP